MYKYVAALCLSRSIGAQWETVDLQSILVFDIFNKYRQVYLTLSSVYLDDTVYVDLEVLRNEYSSYNDTLTALLTELGTRALPTVAELPNARVRYAKYSDAFYSGYLVDTTLIGVGTPANYPADERKDLKITRPGYKTDLSLLHTHCLVSVNGFLHRTDTDGKYGYVVDGRKSLEKAKQNHLGILSFLDIGAVEKLPIAPEDIYAQDTDSDLKSHAYIRINVPVTNKTVMLVLGGYLVMQQAGVFWQTGDQTFVLNFLALPMLERYFESSRFLDLSALGLSQSSENPDEINAAEFLSDTVLKKYLTLSQSFFVVVDTPALFTEKIYLRHYNLPGMFIAHQDPVYPLFVGYGRMAEYWKVFEAGYWSVAVQDSFTMNYVFSKRPVADLQNVTPNAIPGNTFKHSDGFLLQLGTYK